MAGSPPRVLVQGLGEESALRGWDGLSPDSQRGNRPLAQLAGKGQ